MVYALTMQIKLKRSNPDLLPLSIEQCVFERVRNQNLHFLFAIELNIHDGIGDADNHCLILYLCCATKVDWCP